MTTVRDVVKLYRQRSGLPLRQFAAAVGCSHQEVANWEAGRHTPAHHILIPLLHGNYDGWCSDFAQDVLAVLYPSLIKPTRFTNSNKIAP